MLVTVLLYVFAALLVLFVGLSVVGLCVKPGSVYRADPAERNPFEGQIVRFVEDPADAENADGQKGHLEAAGPSVPPRGAYARVFKRLLDVVLSFGGLVVLSPVFAVISLAIVIDDPGPVLFAQKRVGRDKRFFKLHKFRSMKMSTPHDVPTHMLDDPDHYITRVGRFLRAHSLDELPQIWDIFIGNMSVIGPRPALWNQDLLIAERDRGGANALTPGLTGLAQINGRDELSLKEKARLDVYYADHLSFALDLKCFFGSVHVFKSDNSIVEGGAEPAAECHAVPLDAQKSASHTTE